MYRVNILRMTIKKGMAEEFEAQAAKQIQKVSENEPGTLLYGFCRRNPNGSTILPKPPVDNPEYIHLMAYKDEAAQQLHLDIERDWWGPTFRQYMDGPWVAERFESPDVVTGVSRNKAWNPNEMFRFAFHRFKVKEGMAEEFEAQAARQIGMVSENEPGTVLYTFCRRSPDGSTFLPRSTSGHPEYLHFMAYSDEAAQKRHLEIEHRTEGWAWGPVFRSYLEAPLENEAFAAEQIVTGITRDAAWSPTTP